MPSTTTTPDQKTPPSIYRWVFWPAAAIVIVFVAFAMLAPTAAETAFGAIQSSIVANFGWYYVLIATIFVVFSLWVGFSRYGDIKLGQDDDKPEFSLGSWFSLLFAAGMGIGLVFYGVSEPLSHFANPRPGVTGTETQLAQSAMSQTFLHWGVHAWSIYVVIGLALAYAIHRRKRPMSIRWTLEPLLGKRVRGGWGNAIDVVALVGTLFGVATSLGLGVLQIAAGLESTGVVEPSKLLEIGLIVVITCVVLFSVLSGVNKGMKWLSNFNLILAALLVLFLLIVGPTQFLLRDFVQSMGGYIQNFVALSFNTSAYSGAEGEAGGSRGRPSSASSSPASRGVARCGSSSRASSWCPRSSRACGSACWAARPSTPSCRAPAVSSAPMARWMSRVPSSRCSRSCPRAPS
jgi:choline/glycine/proline betaine transport protein